MNYLDSAAQFSDDGRHRLLLTRRWAEATRHAGPVAFVGINPSKAGARQDDPTIRKCVGFADRWGYGSLEMVNLHTIIETDLRLARITRALVNDPRADQVLRDAFKRAGLVVVAWGNLRKAERPRAAEVLGMIHEAGRLPFCLGKTAGGYPPAPVADRLRHAAGAVRVVARTNAERLQVPGRAT